MKKRPSKGVQQSGTGPIARKLIAGLRRYREQKVVPLVAVREGRAKYEQIHADAERRRDQAPIHGIYLYAHDLIVTMGEFISGERPAWKLAERIERYQEEYGPSGPPISPITSSFLTTWIVYDVGIGVARESLGSIALAIFRAMNGADGIAELMHALVVSRAGLYVFERWTDLGVELRELVTGERVQAVVPSGRFHDGRGLWIARVLPPPLPGLPGLALTTPYVVTSPGEREWMAFFERTLGSVTSAAYHALMKRGHRAENYWLEYLFEAYSTHTHEAVFVEGLPDVAESRPFSSVNMDKRAELVVHAPWTTKRPR